MPGQWPLSRVTPAADVSSDVEHDRPLLRPRIEQLRLLADRERGPSKDTSEADHRIRARFVP
jgi:hypothetical protein